VRHKARVIVFDEPTALTPEEKHHFFALVEGLKSRGVSIVFISHAIEEALAIADRITILRDGEHIAADATATFDRDKIIRAMVGRSLSGELYKRRGREQIRTPGRRVLSVQDLTMGNTVRNNSFSAYEDQITGLFGLVGSGRSETARIIGGIIKRDFFHGGEVRFEGRSARYRTPAPPSGTGSSMSLKTESWRASSRQCQSPTICMRDCWLKISTPAAASRTWPRCAPSPIRGRRR